MDIERQGHPEEPSLEFTVELPAREDRVLADPEVQRAIETQGISPEDTAVIAELAAVGPDELIASYHNFFSPHRNVADPQESAAAAIRGRRELHQQDLVVAENAGDSHALHLAQQRIILDSGMLVLTENYGLHVAAGIARILEGWQPPA